LTNLIDNIKTHLGYVALIGVLGTGTYLGVHSWIQEHDARIRAEEIAKAADTQVLSLQKSIADRDKVAAEQVAPVVKIIREVQTVPQAVAALPQVVNTPLAAPVKVQPDNSVLIPEPDVLPLFQQVADDKVCRIQLDTATKDLADTQGIVKQREAEIATLKKPRGFWKRVGSTLKTVAVGIGIGAVLGAKL
jgi:hypothetical protein